LSWPTLRGPSRDRRARLLPWMARASRAMTSCAGLVLWTPFPRRLRPKPDSRTLADRQGAEMTARLEVIVGPMFSGKTERLIARLHRAQYARKRVRILKPAHDTRTQGSIAARSVNPDGSTEVTATAS